MRILTALRDKLSKVFFNLNAVNLEAGLEFQHCSIILVIIFIVYFLKKEEKQQLYPYNIGQNIRTFNFKLRATTIYNEISSSLVRMFQIIHFKTRIRRIVCSFY